MPFGAFFMPKKKKNFENSCVTKKDAYLYSMTNANNTTMTNLETAKQQLSNVNMTAIIQAACKQFTDACYDEGLTVEKTKRMMYSAEGLEVIAKLAAKAI